MKRHAALLFCTAILMGSPKEKLEAFRKKENVCGIAAVLVQPATEGVKREVITLGNTGRHTRISVKEETFFRLGRLTQIFTAELADKVLDREAPLSQLFPKATRLPKRGKAELSLDHFLVHASGLDAALPNCFNRKTATMHNLLSHVGKARLTADPGSVYRCLDLNYAILTLAVAHKTLQNFPDIFAQEVLKNYPHLRFELSLPDRQKLAFGHVGTKREEREGDPPFSPFSGATGLYGTIADLGAWLEKVVAGDRALPNPVSIGEKMRSGPFSVEMLSSTLMLRSYILSDRYLGYSLFLAYVPATKTGIAVIANSDCGVETIGRDLLAGISSGS